MYNTLALPAEQYDEIETALMRTASGRAFLKEHARQNRVISSDLVLRAISRARPDAHSDLPAEPLRLLQSELQQIRQSILQTREEVAHIRPQEIGDNQIMAVVGELDAIVTATERATTEILSAAEEVQEHVGELREKGVDQTTCDAIEVHITNIFTACSFQDITGQRVTKVVSALEYVEQRVNSMIEIWGCEGAKCGSIGIDMDHRRPDANLLEGPQLEGAGVTQNEIDQIFRENDPSPKCLDDKDASVPNAVSRDVGDVSDSSETVLTSGKIDTDAAAAYAEKARQSDPKLDQSDIDTLFE